LDCKDKGIELKNSALLYFLSTVQKTC
jgi:hypothetical protein